MNLIEISLRRPVFAWILMAALIIFGAVSLNRLGVSQMPDVNFPILTVTINYPGAAPEVIESEIIDRMVNVDADEALSAALVFARRKRIGPYAREAISPDNRQKMIAALLRAGHSYDVSRKILSLSANDITSL